MDKFKVIYNYINSLNSFSDELKLAPDAVIYLSNLQSMIDNEKPNMTAHERAEFERNFINDYKKFRALVNEKMRALSKDDKDFKLVKNIKMPSLKRVDLSKADDFAEFAKLDLSQVSEIAEELGFDYSDKNERAQFLQALEKRQHMTEHEKAKSGLVNRALLSLWAGNLGELLDKENLRNIQEKDGEKIKDRGDFKKAYVKDIGLNLLESVNPFKSKLFRGLKGINKAPSWSTQIAYNAGVPALREVSYSKEGDRDFNPLNVLSGTAVNYGTPIVLQRSGVRFGRRIDADDLTPAGEFKGWLGAQRAMKKTRERLDSEMKALGKGEGKLIAGKGRGGTRVPKHWTAKDIDDYMNLKDRSFSHVDKFESALEELSPKFKGRVWVDDPAGVEIVRKLERNIKDIPAEEGERIIRGFAERTRERVPVFSKAGEKLQSLSGDFSLANPNFSDISMNYFTNKMGQSKAGDQFINIAGNLAPEFLYEDDKNLTETIQKALMPKKSREKILGDVQIAEQDREVIDDLILHPEKTLGVGFDLKEREAIRDVQLTYPEVFARIQEKAKGKRGGK